MAKGCYVGVSNKARKVKKIYVGVAGTARKVKKAYVGVSGKARLWWSSAGTVTYYGTATNLSASRQGLAAATLGSSMAIFGGGRGSSMSKVVNGYNASLSMTTASSGFGTARAYLAAAASGSYLLFCGGYTSGTAVTTSVNAYNSSLTRSSPTALGTSRGGLAGATSGSYAIFAGGAQGVSNYSGTSQTAVDAYNETTKQSMSATLGTGRSYLAAATSGSYAIFGGGGVYSRTTYIDDGSNKVDIFNGLTKVSTSVTLSQARMCLAAASANGKVIFAGGSLQKSAINYSTVDAFDGTTKLTTSAALSTARRQLAGASVGDYAVFGGGYGSGAADTVDVFDASVTRQTLSLTLSAARYELAAAAIGNYGIFAGGYNGSSRSNVADVYTAA